MAEIIHTDICAIGGRSCGLSVAAEAVKMGAETVLIERDKMGGDCLNTGCTRSKALLGAGNAAKAAAVNFKMNIFSSKEPDVNFAAVKAHVASLIDSITPHDSTERFTDLGVRVIQAEACFQSAHVIVVDRPDGPVRVSAHYFVIASSAHPCEPPIDGLKTVPFHTKEIMSDLNERPDHLMIIGGGPIGIERALFTSFTSIKH